MSKGIVNIRNIIILALILILVILIVNQQPQLEEKRDAYKNAVETSEKIDDISSEKSIENDMSGTESDSEQYARDEGYIYPGEKLIEYDK